MNDLIHRQGTRAVVLDERTLLAAGLSAYWSGGVLTVSDDTGGQTVRVRQAADQVSVDGASIHTDTGDVAAVPATQLTEIDLWPLANDVIDLNSQAVAGQQPLSVGVRVAAGGGDALNYGGPAVLVGRPGEVFRTIPGGRGLFDLAPDGTLLLNGAAVDGPNVPGGQIVTDYAYDPTTNGVVLLEGNGNLWRQDLGSGNWKQIDGANIPGGVAVSSFALDGRGGVVLLEGNGNLWRQDLETGGFSLMRNGVKSFLKATDGSLFVLQTSGALVRSVPDSTGWGTWAGHMNDAVALAQGSDGSVFALERTGAVSRWTADGSVTGAWAGVAGGGVAAADGTIWYLGNSSVDDSGNHAIYRITGGKEQLMPGSGTQLQVTGGMVTVVSAGGVEIPDLGNGVRVSLRGGTLFVGPDGVSVPLLQRVRSITATGNGRFVVNVGDWLKATVAAQYSGTGTASLSFSDVQINLERLASLVNPFIDGLKKAAAAVTQLFQSIPGLQDIASKVGYSGPTDLAAMLQIAAQADPTRYQQAGQVADALNRLRGVVAAINALPYLSGSWVSIGLTFTATATASAPTLSLYGLSGDLLQQLGGQFATAGTQLRNSVGVSVQGAEEILRSLLSGNGSVTLLSYNLNSLPAVSTSVVVDLLNRR
jgi:hypothetical protein